MAGFQDADEVESALNELSLETVDLDTVLARRASPRVRALQVASALAVLLIASIVLLRTAWPARPSQAKAPGIPIANVNLPSVPLTITSDVSYGTLTLNGGRLSGTVPQVVRLRPGPNTVTLDARPFPSTTCTVTGPITAMTAGNPVVDTSGDGPSPCSFSSGPPGSGDAASLTFNLTGSNLPVDMLAPARGAAEQALAALPTQTGTVPVGTSYITGFGYLGDPMSQRATQPLLASLTYALALPDSSSPSFGGLAVPCGYGLCLSGGAWTHAVSADAWIVAVPVEQHWRFTTQAGDTVSDVTEISALNATVVLAYDPQGGWQRASDALASAASIPPLTTVTDPCRAAVSWVQHVTPLAVGEQSGVTGVEGDIDGLSGCAVTVQDGSGTAQGRFIWRFGVLSAADAQAHALDPALPVASGVELDVIGAWSA